jgi:uncharacterized protein (DUF302 family)
MDMSLTITESPHGVRATVDRLAAAVERRGIAVLARVDHGGGARAAGLQLADEELLIFGDPRAATTLMRADPQVGYELPLRTLVWDEGGRTRVGYRPPPELAERYDVGGRAEVLRRMQALLEELVSESVAG